VFSDVDLVQCILDGTAIAVSDGSLKLNMGTTAYHIQDSMKGENISVEGLLLVPGFPCDLTSQRCELAGIYGIITVTKTVIDQHLIQSGSIEAGCNNDASLRIFNPSYVFDPYQPDHNLLSSMQARICNSPIAWIGRHVAGHQDDHEGPLDHWAVLNIKMDQIAKAYWQIIASSPDERPDPYMGRFFQEGWALWTDDYKWPHVSKHGAYSVLHTPKIKAWWVHCGQMTEDTSRKIDWNLIGPAMAHLSSARTNDGKRNMYPRIAASALPLSNGESKWMPIALYAAATMILLTSFAALTHAPGRNGLKSSPYFTHGSLSALHFPHYATPSAPTFKPGVTEPPSTEPPPSLGPASQMPSQTSPVLDGN
jgi:hypothetical protein